MFSPDGRWLVTSERKRISFWKTGSWEFRKGDSAGL